MRHENVSAKNSSGFDWKGAGYLISILSVLLLGAVAWPGPDEPKWHMPVLGTGMVASILGMTFRYKAHLNQQRELRRTRSAGRGS